MKEFWNERYARPESPLPLPANQFFKESIDQHVHSGRVFMLAEGEGRNAVYAASRGLEVHAFDISDAGRDKAMKLADDAGVTMHYQLGDFLTADLDDNSYDAVGLIYAHL